MKKDNKFILAALGSNYLLALLVQWFTGSGTGWWVAIIVTISFLPTIIQNAKNENKENGK